MATEIERKFLVISDEWRHHVTDSISIAQGYIQAREDRAVRVRLKGDRALLTIKVARSSVERLEFEYEIPFADAKQLIASACTEGSVTKTRHLVPASNGLFWEIDEFLGDNASLVVAEIELPSVEHTFSRPQWLGDEVSDDPRYLNASLAHYPWARWPENTEGPK